MSICWNGSLIIADTRFVGASGIRVAGGFGIRLSVMYQVRPWSHGGALPQLRLSPAPVTLWGHEDVQLGYAIPEMTVPFPAGSSHDNFHLHLLSLAPSQMEVIERVRAGQDIQLLLKLQGEVWRGHEFTNIQETVSCPVSQSDWLKVLEQCEYGRSILFEVPLPASHAADAPAPAQYLQRAKTHFVKGHYDDAVAACRLALEAITTSPTDKGDTDVAVKAWKGGRASDLSIGQRELVLRQVLAQYTHLAHHHEPGENTSRYDQSMASMVLGMTASLLSRFRVTSEEDL